MIIRSQDGMDLIVLDDIGIMESRTVSGAFDIESYKHDAHVVIGRYAKKEIAKKVLDKIQVHYAEFRAGNVCEFSTYQMPQDEKEDLEGIE